MREMEAKALRTSAPKAYNPGIMATKKSSDGSARSNKIRFVLVEADISDGNLSELTQAITSALRPATTMRQLPRVTAPALAPVTEAAEESDTPGVEELEDDQPTNGDGSAAKPARVKKFKPPDYLPDLLAGEKGAAFKEFAREKAPATKSAKYLVSTYWLKEKGDSPTVNANKIYTCFKTAGWSTGFNDWNQTFHNLVHSEHLRKTGNGEFAINPLGEDAVAKGTA
jgi:hypothetical protein